jgi:hypothetical protein
MLESENESKHRTQEEVAWRTLALLVVAVKGEGLEQSMVDKVVARYDLERHFSPGELAFIENPKPTEQERIQFTWRYEAAWTLLWSLGYVEELGQPTAICDVQRAVALMKERSAEQFLHDARLRSQAEILDQTDLIYRYHWAVVDAHINGKTSPAGLEPGVTMERHYALNWLVGYMDQAWDDVSTDT